MPPWQQHSRNRRRAGSNAQVTSLLGFGRPAPAPLLFPGAGCSRQGKHDALAAYNAGDGAVQRAVKRGGSKDFARLSSLRLLPAETRAYVPAVLAATRLLRGAGLRLPEPGRERGEIIVYATPAILTGLRGQKAHPTEARD